MRRLPQQPGIVNAAPWRVPSVHARITLGSSPATKGIRRMPADVSRSCSGRETAPQTSASIACRVSHATTSSCLEDGRVCADCDVTRSPEVSTR